MAVRRAYKEAKTPPTGPVFISFPWDTMDETGDLNIVPSSTGFFRTRPDTDAVARASQLLSQADNPIIVVGDRVAQSGAAAQVVRLAEQLGARVYATSMSEVNFPNSHDLYGGILNTSSPATQRLLAGADVVMAVGTDVFSSFLYVSEPFLGSQTKLIHLDSSAQELEKIYPTEVGILADPGAGLAELAEALDQEMSASNREAAATRAATWPDHKKRSAEQYQIGRAPCRERV